MSKIKIEDLIYKSLDETCKLLPGKIQIEKTLETPLFGGSSQLDSMGLVTFLVDLEQKIEDEFDLDITIADEKAMSLKNSPFRTVSTLKEYMETLLEKN